MTLAYFDEIKYGVFSNLEALVDVDTHELWVTIPVMERLLNIGENQARKKLTSKSLQSFAGKGLNLGKLVTAKRINGRPCKVRAIPFDTFLTVVKWQATNKDDTAIALLVAGFADSFSSLVLEQCGVKVTKAERQKVVSFYLTSYHEYFDWVRDTYLKRKGFKPNADYYQRINMAINNRLFNKSSFGSDRLGNATSQELREIECFERFAMRQVHKYPNTDPCLVTNLILDLYC